MNKAKQNRHSDGTLCPEGTIKVHSKFKLCCEEFGRRTLACYHDIRYEWWPKYSGWFVLISPLAGGGGIRFSFCPHCGTKLKGKAVSRRNSVESESGENKFVLQHVNILNGDEEDVKFIGIYDSKALAKAVIKRLRKMPGFRTQGKFCVDKYGVNATHWAEGFITVKPKKMKVRKRSRD